MSPALEDVVGSAIIDRDFRVGLLNGKRARLLSQFDLSPEEHQVLMDIRAESLESFARQLYGWVEAQRAKRPVYLPA
jgi:hypothetical protein